MKNQLGLLTLTFIALVTTLNAQVPQANNWHFGDKLSVSFATGTPVLNPPSAMEAFEGIVSMSDANGQLLFYTNGGGRPFIENSPPELQQSTGIIWNRNHEVMYDMRGEEGGGFSARQSCIAMPDPAGEDGVYYLFTMEESEFEVGGNIPGQPEGRGLSYFIIDMNLNGGLGGVRLADQRVYTPAYEALDATPMADGSGYWIICHSDDTDDSKFIITPLTAAGVGAPVETPVSRVSGKIEFSPNGLFIFNDRKLYSFDNETGTIASDPVSISGVSNQAACFTPDSRFLYSTESRAGLGEVFVRYDLRDLSAPLVLQQVELPGGASVILTAPLQIGPNGNIYFLEQTFSPGNPTRYGLSEIVCVSGENPTINRFLIDLPAAEGADFFSQYLPQFVDAIFAVEPRPDTTRLEPDTIRACANEAVLLTARETGTYSWSTGATTDTTSVTASGEYCVTITGGCFPTVDCQTVMLEDTAINVTFIRTEDRGCEGEFDVYRIEAGGEVRLVSVIVLEQGGTTPLFVNTFVNQQEFTLPKFPDAEQPRLNLIVDTEFCDDLSFTQPLEPYEDDRFRPELRVTAEGEICDGREITLTVENGPDDALAVASVRYEDGNTDNPRTLEAMFGTEIPVTVFSECGDSTELVFNGPVAEFCTCEDEVPELISPNGDNVNDEFRLYSDCPAEDYTLFIFNRWGQRVFESTNPEQVWDGTINGTPQNSDVYLYRMVFRFPNTEEVQVREGAFNLIR